MKAYILTALLVAAGSTAAYASSGSVGTAYSDSLAGCYSKASPILGLRYGYDDRNCAEKTVGSGAVYEGAHSSLALQIHYARSLPACIDENSPILDPHYGYDNRVCVQ